VPFETQVVRHLPVLASEALVTGLVIASTRQLRAQSQQRPLMENEPRVDEYGGQPFDRILRLCEIGLVAATTEAIPRATPPPALWRSHPRR
jgi:hypothetical protein